MLEASVILFKLSVNKNYPCKQTNPCVNRLGNEAEEHLKSDVLIKAWLPCCSCSGSSQTPPHTPLSINALLKDRILLKPGGIRFIVPADIPPHPSLWRNSFTTCLSVLESSPSSTCFLLQLKELKSVQSAEVSQIITNKLNLHCPKIRILVLWSHGLRCLLCFAGLDPALCIWVMQIHYLLTRTSSRITFNKLKPFLHPFCAWSALS